MSKTKEPKRYAEVGKRGRQRSYSKRTFSQAQLDAQDFFRDVIVIEAKRLMNESGATGKDAYTKAVREAWASKKDEYISQYPNSTAAKKAKSS